MCKHHWVCEDEKPETKATCKHCGATKYLMPMSRYGRPLTRGGQANATYNEWDQSEEAKAYRAANAIEIWIAERVLQ